MNQYGYHCPECDSDEGIKVAAVASAWVFLMEDGVEDDGVSWEWEDASDARCIECNWHGKVSSLVVEKEDEPIDPDQPCPECHGEVGHRINCSHGIAFSDYNKYPGDVAAKDTF